MATPATGERAADRGQTDTRGAIHILNAGLLAGLWLFSGLVYPHLPEQVPGHIGLTQVTRWVPRSPGAWFALPLIGTFNAFLMYAFSMVVDRGARALNIPQKKRVLALPPAARRQVLGPVRRFLLLLAAWVLGLMCWLQWLFYRAALGGPEWRQGGYSLAGLLLFTLLPLGLIVRLNGDIRRRLDAQEQLSAARAR